MHRVALAVALAAAGGCAIDASVRVVTTATERCTWSESVAMGAGSDRFRVPDGATEVQVELLPESPATGQAGDVVEVRRDLPGSAGPRRALFINGKPIRTILPETSVTVRWRASSSEPIRSEQLYKIEAESLPWTIEWDVKPQPRFLTNGECRITDVKTAVDLVGPDAGDLELQLSEPAAEGRIRGAVRRKGAR